MRLPELRGGDVSVAFGAYFLDGGVGDTNFVSDELKQCELVQL
jgi:hypothetical protein